MSRSPWESPRRAKDTARRLLGDGGGGDDDGGDDGSDGDSDSLCTATSPSTIMYQQEASSPS